MKRQAVLFAFRELLNARKPELARLVTSELGKVVSDAMGARTTCRGGGDACARRDTSAGGQRGGAQAQSDRTACSAWRSESPADAATMSVSLSTP